MTMLFFKKKKNNVLLPEMEEIVFTFPLYVDLYKRGFEEIANYEPKRLSGKEAYDRIIQDCNGTNWITEVCDTFHGASLQKYYPLPDIVFDFRIRITDAGTTLITAKAKLGISDEEKKQSTIFLTAYCLTDGVRIQFRRLKRMKMILKLKRFKFHFGIPDSFICSC